MLNPRLLKIVKEWMNEKIFFERTQPITTVQKVKDEKLKQTLEEEWQKVRKSFHYPLLPQPKLVKDGLRDSINIRNLEITVSESFIKMLEKHEISSEESLNEVLTHELTHFMKFPGSILNILKLQESAQEIVEKYKINRLREAFIEAQTNIYMLNERKHPATTKINKILYNLLEKDKFRRLMHRLYQEVSEQDLYIESRERDLVNNINSTFESRLIDEEKKLIEKLKDIDYTNKEQEINNFKRFVHILKDYQLPPSQNKEEGDFGSGNNLDGFSNNQIREGLKQFAQECSNPDKYEEVVKQVLNKGGEAGSDKGITQLADNFYTALAEKYTIPIIKKPIHKNGTLYPYSHIPFQIGDSLKDIDLYSAPGLFPGIMKRWLFEEGEVYGDHESIPNSFLLIDNSPSMFTPNFISNEKEVMSPSRRPCKHIVGATAISNAYLFNGSRVAVYNFGSDDHLTNPTKDREVVHRELRRYSDKGGTKFNPKFLEEVLKNSKEEYDISIISDMEISNLESFIDTVLKIPQTHRIHLLYTGLNAYVEKLRQIFGNKENVAILPLICEKDIQEITMGELQKSIK
jgi:hypothetical protein